MTICTIFLRSFGSEPTVSFGSTAISYFSSRRCAAACIALRRMIPSRYVGSLLSRRFSLTLIVWTRLMSWCTVTMRCAKACSAPLNRTGRPSSSMVPDPSGWTPAMILARVDLPAPFSPTSPRTRPAAIEKSTPRSALTAAKLRVSPLHCSRTPLALGSREAAARAGSATSFPGSDEICRPRTRRRACAPPPKRHDGRRPHLPVTCGSLANSAAFALVSSFVPRPTKSLTSPPSSLVTTVFMPS